MALAKDTDIQIAYLRECFSYDSNDEVTWLHRPRKHFLSDQAWHTFNTRFAGRSAGTLSKRDGYRHVRLTIAGRKRDLLVHRVAWALVHDCWPDDQVDHINRDRSDKKIRNLREATHAQNTQNASLRSDNASGVKGVYWHKDKREWCAEIAVNGRRLIFGRFDSFMDACHARWAAEIEHHPFRVRQPEPSKPKPFDRVPDGAFVTGCWSIGSNPHWAVIDYA